MQLALLSAVTYWIANRVASRLQALMGKVCCYVSAWRCGHLRPMDFVCGAFVCDVVCASPTPRRRATRTSPLQGTCHHPTTTSAAGEPARRRRRAPQEPPLLRAPKSLRAPPSWAHFSVAFSQAGDLGFPIFTKPYTVCPGLGTKIRRLIWPCSADDDAAARRLGWCCCWGAALRPGDRAAGSYARPPRS